jgi:malonate decarboxylase delta subunit
MEKFTNTYRSEPLSWPTAVTWELAGVVGSGNLEVLVEPGGDDHEVRYIVETSIAGFRKSWEAALEDFAHGHPVGGTTITMHDQGAVPAVVQLRLRQAIDRLEARRDGN